MTCIARDPRRGADFGFDEKDGGRLDFPGAGVDREDEIEDLVNGDVLDCSVLGILSTSDRPSRALPCPPLKPRALPRPRLSPLKALPGSPVLPQRGEVFEEPDAPSAAIN